jgi:drug/metabolite transporter (DMT)-like permease
MASAEAKRTALAANAGLLLAAILAAASVVATRVAVQSVPPLSLAVMRYAQGGHILGVCLLLLARSQLRVRRQDLLTLAVLGTLLFAAFPSCSMPACG